MIILDSKTRWNSLVAMLERLLQIWPSVAKALIDCKSELSIIKEELSAIQGIVSSLQPGKAGAEKLANREMTILGAEGVFGFIRTVSTSRTEDNICRITEGIFAPTHQRE